VEDFDRARQYLVLDRTVCTWYGVTSNSDSLKWLVGRRSTVVYEELPLTPNEEIGFRTLSALGFEEFLSLGTYLSTVRKFFKTNAKTVFSIWGDGDLVDPCNRCEGRGESLKFLINRTTEIPICAGILNP
jgi:hypothetical protein